jgi:hypothetical protein
LGIEVASPGGTVGLHRSGKYRNGRRDGQARDRVHDADRRFWPSRRVRWQVADALAVA